MLAIRIGRRTQVARLHDRPIHLRRQRQDSRKKLVHRAPATDQIRVSDSFMQRVVPAIMAQSPGFRDRGTLLDNYLAINNELRRDNNQVLTDLGGRSTAAFLWKLLVGVVSSGSWKRSGWEKKGGTHPDAQGGLGRMPTPAVLPP